MLHRYIHRQGQRPLTTLNLFARSCPSTVWYDLTRPHTPPRECVRAASADFFAQLCNTRVETRAEFARVKRAKRDPLDNPFVAAGIVTRRSGETLPHVPALARRNGFRTVHMVFTVSEMSRFYIILAGRV